METISFLIWNLEFEEQFKWTIIQIRVISVNTDQQWIIENNVKSNWKFGNISLSFLSSVLAIANNMWIHDYLVIMHLSQRIEDKIRINDLG